MSATAGSDTSARHHSDLLGLFANHKVAANLLMLVLIVAGIFALSRLNAQFFPNFELEYVQVRTLWTAASPEDIEDGITNPIELALRNLNGVKKMTSTSATGISVITLEYNEGTDMGAALDQVTEKVRGVRSLPADAQQPDVLRLYRREPIARILLVGSDSLQELRPLARRVEQELLERGIDEVEITGLPKQEISVEVPQQRLLELGLTLEQLGQRLARASQDRPAGLVGRDDSARQLRTLEQRRDELGFEQLLIDASSGTGGGDPGSLSAGARRLLLGDIATVKRRAINGEVTVEYQGRAAVELRALRDQSGDSLKSAQVLNDWVADARPRLPPGVELVVFDQSWELLAGRIDLLLKNGLGGLLLVVVILFLFLNGRVAFWVAIGIPVSFLATLGILWLIGGSINMISLFGMIMALGVIVDDAIVVGEDALTHYQTGENPLQAAEGGARRMLAPVISSSLTTVAAFLPLLTVGGIIGNILFDIPLVVICVIVASLLECFLILPGHLQHSFRRLGHVQPQGFRKRFDKGFERFRDQRFRPALRLALGNRFLSLSLVLAAMIVAVGLVAGGRIGFSFFPGIEGNIVNVNVAFVSGTPKARVDAFMTHLQDTLRETDEALGGNLVRVAMVRHNLGKFADGRSSTRGQQLASMFVELTPSESRSVRNETLIDAWKARVIPPAGVERFTVVSRKGGPPGRDVEVRLFNAAPGVLKQASLELQQALGAIDGVSAIEDDMPWGPQQLVIRLGPRGEALGLNADLLGRQLRAAFDGYLAEIYTIGADEVEVRVGLPRQERDRLGVLQDLNIILPNGKAVAFGSVASLHAQQGFDVLRHTNAARTVTIYGDVNSHVTKDNIVRQQLASDVLPRLADRYNLEYSFEGRAADQRETTRDMKTGGLYALLMIYIVLAWVFGSWGWPLIVMVAIPFGLVGAIVGHWLLGIDLTILSMFGFFGLSGIVVNDSIILVVFYRQLRESGVERMEAIETAASLRLRAVLLTSLTTIAGLTPLLFETSLQAQFLIPMAVTISFGLAFSTLLVLFVIPVILSIYEGIFADRSVAAERELPSPGI